MTTLTWAQKLARMLWLVKTGERAENLRQARQRFDNVNSLTYATREKLMGSTGKEHLPEDDMQIIGEDNRTITNNSTGTDLAKVALGLGIMATGIGLPIGGYFVANGLKNMQPDIVNHIKQEATDTDTKLELDLPE